MLPGFVAELSLYQSRGIYVNAEGATSSGACNITPAATNYCVSGNGRVQCGTLSGVGEGLLWGGLFGGAVGGGVGALVGGIIGGLYCLIFGCD